MKAIKIRTAYAVLALGLLSACSAITERGTTQNSTQQIAAEQQSMTAEGAACEGYGPQSPRDIDQRDGANKRIFSVAPPSEQMNLCNIHFHNPAEHKAAAFSVYAGDTADGGGGYQCKNSQTLSASELAAPEADICNGVKPGDTIEMHWVYSSCDVKPGEGLGSCLSPKCVNPNLRVETQVFTVVNDPSALDFNDFDYAGKVADEYHQPDALPTKNGTPVEYLGSTTGPAYSEQKCSPLQVSWSVRPQCAKVDINSLGRWCENNAFNENHAHGVRPLVTNPELLSDIEQ